MNSNSLLDLIGLPDSSRKDAHIIVLEEYPSSFLNKERLTKIENYIKTILKVDNNFSVITLGSRVNLSGNINEETKSILKVLSFNDINTLKEIWSTELGDYLLITPKIEDLEGVNHGLNSDEEIIGLILMKVKKLLLKSPDGYELLYLYFQ